MNDLINTILIFSFFNFNNGLITKVASKLFFFLLILLLRHVIFCVCKAISAF